MSITKKSIRVRYLLDVNILVALSIPSHPSHRRVYEWFHREPHRKWATCPLTQGGFLRAGCHTLGTSRQTLRYLYECLVHDCQSPDHEFWPLDIDLCEFTEIVRSRIIGPKQLTDLQLLLLAHRRQTQLVTRDAGIRELAAGTRYANSLLLL